MKTQWNKLVCSIGFRWSSLVPLLPIGPFAAFTRDFKTIIETVLFLVYRGTYRIFFWKGKDCLLSFPSFLHGFQDQDRFRNEWFVRYSRNWSVSYLEAAEPHIWGNLHIWEISLAHRSVLPGNRRAETLLWTLQDWLESSPHHDLQPHDNVKHASLSRVQSVGYCLPFLKCLRNFWFPFLS